MKPRRRIEFLRAPELLRGAVEAVCDEREPRWDMRETPRSFIVAFPLSDFKKDELSIELREGVLTVRGEKRADSGGRKHGGPSRAPVSRSFCRSIALPAPVKNEAKAVYHEGELRVTISKIKETKTIKIDIG